MGLYSNSVLMLNLGLRIKETKEVYEGELTELTPAEAENPLSGYGKTVSHVIVGLKTVKGTKQLRLDPSIYESILKEKIVVGDVVYVEANTGAVKVSHSFIMLAGALKFFRGLVGQTPTHPPSISNPRHTSHYRRATCTNARNSCRISPSAISTPLMLVLKVGRTSCPSWAVWSKRRKLRL